MTRDEIREIVMDCLKDYGVAKAIKRRKPGEATPDPLARDTIYHLSTVWLDCIGAANIGRIANAFKPLLVKYEAKWIEAGLRAYATELHRENNIRYASPESFAGKASGYILPVVPSNELTETEAGLLGPEMVSSRDHAAALGLLTARARG